jgi:hypothetical protein
MNDVAGTARDFRARSCSFMGGPSRVAHPAREVNNHGSPSIPRLVRPR